MLHVSCYPGKPLRTLASTSLNNIAPGIPGSKKKTKMATVSVSELVVYPIKSCKGISLSSSALTNAGLLYDREWMIVKADSGKFVTQRELASLALVEVGMPAEALVGDWGSLPPDAAMSVTAPGAPLLKVPLSALRPGADIRKVTVWGWTGAARDEGEDAAQWFTQYVGVPCRLVRYVGSGSAAALQAAATSAGHGDLPLVRHTDEEFAVGYEVRFSDGFPMLLATEASLQDLSSRLQGPALPMNRFRPNIIMGGAQPWAEDTWRDVELLPSGSSSSSNSSAGEGAGPVRLTAVKPCSRCKVTTIDQATGVEGDEPLETLRVFRSGKALGWSEERKSWTHAVFFGWNCVPCRPAPGARISVGDVLRATSQQIPTALVAAQ